MIISSIEHAAVSAATSDFAHKICGVDQKGMLSLSELRQMIDEDTVLISIIYANNEIG